MLEKLKVHHHQPSTDVNYYGICKLFNNFFLLDWTTNQAVQEDRLALFATHLVINEKLKSQTVKNYTSAVRSILKSENIFLNNDSYRLSVLAKACKLHNDDLTVRLPIQKNLMLIILDKITDYFDARGQPYHAKLYKAIISAGYYGLSELVN